MPMVTDPRNALLVSTLPGKRRILIMRGLAAWALTIIVAQREDDFTVQQAQRIEIQ